MTETEYKTKHYPQDFILIGNEIYPLPKGGKLSIEQKEVASVFTTADGTKRKDIIRKYKSASMKFSVLLENDFNTINKIIQKIEQSSYDEKKELCLKKETMIFPPEDNSVLPLFEHIKIDIISPIKYAYNFRKNSMFVYSGVSLKIN